MLIQDLAERSEGSTTLVVHGESAPPCNLRAVFRQWNDKLWPFKVSKINQISLEEAFDMLDRERYSIKELQNDPLPLGVDADKLEVHLIRWD
jgi:hypothetical protein